jgi:hypothetical protein
MLQALSNYGLGIAHSRTLTRWQLTMIDDRFPFTGPRLQGIYEQHRRARRFVQLARRCKNPTTRLTNLIAAVYPTRATVELMLGAAEKQELKSFQNKDAQKSRKDFEKVLAPMLPYYYLLEKIRIHDFHRFGCIPPNSKYYRMLYGGPVNLKASKGTAALAVTPKGPKHILTGNSKIKEQRPLCTRDASFFEEESGKWLSLDEILDNFLRAVPSVIKYFESLHAG